MENSPLPEANPVDSGPCLGNESASGFCLPTDPCDADTSQGCDQLHEIGPQGFVPQSISESQGAVPLRKEPAQPQYQFCPVLSQRLPVVHQMPQIAFASEIELV